MAADKVERCVIALLACRAYPVPVLQTAILAGAAPGAHILSYESVYSSGVIPHVIRKPFAAQPTNWLLWPGHMPYESQLYYSQCRLSDYYPDLTYYRLALERNEVSYTLLCTTAASLPMRTAMQFIDVPSVMLHTLLEKPQYAGNASILAVLLGCAARNKDGAYLDLIVNSEWASWTFGCAAPRYDYPKYVVPWVSTAISYAGKSDNTICDLAIRYLGPYSAALSAIGRSRHAVDEVLKQGGFTGHGAKLDYDIFDEFVEAAVATCSHNIGTVEYNFGALLSLYPGRDVGSTFAEWISRRRKLTMQNSLGSTAKPLDICACILRVAMVRAAPFEIRVTRPADTEVCKCVLSAGPVDGVTISYETRSFLAFHTMEQAVYLYAGETALGDKILEVIGRYTRLAGRLSQALFYAVAADISSKFSSRPHRQKLWWVLRENQQFRRLLVAES